jgi:spore coat polysaccharide biosynthesis predicted glycosyltransferase SpsG
VSREILVVADGGEQAGLGHLSRSTGVAAALAARGLDVACRVYGAPTSVDRHGIGWEPLNDAREIEKLADLYALVFLDSYLVPRQVIESMARRTRLAATHDFGDPPPGAELVVSPAAEGPNGPGRLCGLRYACLEPAFWNPPPPRRRDAVERVLVTTGGGDPGGLASAIAAAAVAAIPAAGVELVRGPYADLVAPAGVELVGPGEIMREALARADLVVCGAGQTMLEACALGTPCLAIVLANNQALSARALERSGAVMLVDPTDDPRLRETLAALAADKESRAAMSRAGQEAVDGAGAARVAAAIERLIP